MENKNTAIRFGVLEKCEKLEKELLQIDNVTNVKLDIDGFWNDIFQVNISVAYDIPLHADNEFLSSSSVFEQVIEIATGNFLKREGYKVTSDESFDEETHLTYHFYFTFDCAEEWKEKIKERDVDMINEKTASDVSDSMCLWRDEGKQW